MEAQVEIKKVELDNMVWVFRGDSPVTVDMCRVWVRICWSANQRRRSFNEDNVFCQVETQKGLQINNNNDYDNDNNSNDNNDVLIAVSNPAALARLPLTYTMS